MLQKLSIFIVLLGCIQLYAQDIVVNGSYEDWENLDPIFVDDLEFQGLNKIDFEHLYVTNDDDFLFLRFDLNKVIEIQEGNDLALLIDADDNLQTGKKINGIGAELRYNLGDRSGTVYIDNEEFAISHEEILLISAPTFSSEEFELMLNLNVELNGKKLFDGERISIRLEDNAAQGDDLPGDLGGVDYTLIDSNRSYDVDLNKVNNSDVRIASFNVLFDRIFDTGATDAYRRLLQATQPDIIAFQEIYDHSAAELKARLEELLPGQDWNVDGRNNDVLVASRYEVEWLKRLSGNAAFKVDVDGQELLLINFHPPCCNDDSGRQQEVDQIMAFVRDSKQRYAEYGFSEPPPFIIAGDSNFVGDFRQANTIVNGEIVNNGTYGSTFSPDLDGTPINYAPTPATGLPAEITWFTPGSFSGGRLDYIFYSDSRIYTMNNFALLTYFMKSADLDAYGLRFDDSAVASDHALIVSDFKFVLSSTEESAKKSFLVYPSPASTYVNIEAVSKADFSIVDMKGRVILNGELSQGINKINTSKLVSGIYIIHVEGGERYTSQKINIVKR